jgi:hypothetical protein
VGWPIGHPTGRAPGRRTCRCTYSPAGRVGANSGGWPEADWSAAMAGVDLVATEETEEMAVKEAEATGVPR